MNKAICICIPQASHVLPGPTVPLLRQSKRGWNEGRESAYELMPGEEERNGAKKIWSILG